MRPVHSAAEIRASEDAFFAANPGVDLMGRAAEHVAAAALDILGERRQVLVVAGPGNNGGDALFAAAALANSGRRVRLWLAAGRANPAGLAAALASGCVPLSADAALAWLPIVNLVIDGLAGIGGRPGLSADVAGFAEACLSRGVPVLAVDLPSGLDADSHLADTSFVATRTVTFAAEKLCHVARPAADRCGRVTVADIGLDLPDARVNQAEAADLRGWWPTPDSRSDKYSRGVVALDVGSPAYPGAALLGALGATHAGAGMVRDVGPVGDLVLAASPSVVLTDGRAQAVVVGSGWGERDDERCSKGIARGVPMVVDAEALLSLPIALPEGSVLTPHAGELARLLDVAREAVVAGPIVHAREAAERFGAVVLLKGATQYVARPDGRVSLAVPGPAWTAQAGSGDVLAGICGTLLAAGLDADRAALAAASIQALTAAAHPGPYPPDEIARLLPGVIARVLNLPGNNT